MKAAQQDLYNNLELWACQQLTKQVAEQDEAAIIQQLAALAEKHGICGNSNGEVAKQLADMGYVLEYPRHWGPAALVERDGCTHMVMERPAPRLVMRPKVQAESPRACAHGQMDCFECWWRDGRPYRPED